MKEKEIELQYEMDSMDKKDIYQELSTISNISTIEKIKENQVDLNYHFLCKKCNKIPVFNFLINKKIEYICNCKDSPGEIFIKDIFNFLYYSEDKENKILKCDLHPTEKYILYCEKCKKNLCAKCAYNCIDHKDKINCFFIFDDIIFNKKEYINKILEKDNDGFIDNSIEFSNTDEFPDYNRITMNINKRFSQTNSRENEILNQDKNLIIQKIEDNFLNEEAKKEIINIIRKFNNDEIFEDEYYYKNLFTIIINDYKNYPNFKHIETISNIEKFIVYYSDDYNEINLNYMFEKHNIKNNSIELFGKIFVENNKDNCFLIIEQKIFELSKFVCLTDIFGNIPINFPFNLDIKLIERKRKEMKNISYMFFEISTITNKSNFYRFNSINVSNMSYMFSNCSSIKKLPDISNLDTTNVKDMSYMFYNCSSIKELPDISKWNIKSTLNVNSMFENCLALFSLPNISIWDTKNIKYMNNMFKNCKSLSDLPNLSIWTINKDTQINDIFEGDILLKGKIPRTFAQSYKDIILRCIKTAYYTMENHLTNFEYSNFYFILYYFVLIFIAICLPFIPLYNSFNLNKTKECINNPIVYFNLSKTKNIYDIAKFLKIFNLKKIKEISKNKNKYINNLLNFTRINGDIMFDSEQIIYQKYNIILIITFSLSYIIFIFLSIKLDSVTIKKQIILLLILSISVVSSLILEFLDFIKIKKISKSVRIFYGRLERIFKIKIPQKNLEELKYFKFSLINTIGNIFVSLIIFLTITKTSKIILTTKRMIAENNLRRKYI